MGIFSGDVISNRSIKENNSRALVVGVLQIRRIKEREARKAREAGKEEIVEAAPWVVTGYTNLPLRHISSRQLVGAISIAQADAAVQPTPRPAKYRMQRGPQSGGGCKHPRLAIMGPHGRQRCNTLKPNGTDRSKILDKERPGGRQQARRPKKK